MILLTFRLNLANLYHKKGFLGQQDFQSKYLKVPKNIDPSLLLFGQKCRMVQLQRLDALLWETIAIDIQVPHEEKFSPNGVWRKEYPKSKGTILYRDKQTTIHDTSGGCLPKKKKVLKSGSKDESY